MTELGRGTQRPSRGEEHRWASTSPLQPELRCSAGMTVSSLSTSLGGVAKHLACDRAQDWE